jgi:uncharacterized protein
MKIVVIYHRADFDGIFCYRIAKRFFDKHYPDADTYYIGWDYGDPMPVVAEDATVYMLDISVDGLMEHPNLNWVDHHKSAMEKYPATIQGYRIDGVAACRLAWQYFGAVNGFPGPGIPTKEDFIERRVSEPEAVRLAGEYDIWDKRDPRADVLQFGLRSKELTDEDWGWLLTVRDLTKMGEYELGMTWKTLTELLQNGKLLQRYQQQNDAEIIQHRSFYVEFEGLRFLALNTARCNSITFAAIDNPNTPTTNHDALLGFYYNGKAWTVSLYHAAHRKDIDLSLIAVKYGGGGHRGACGFRADTLPFLNPPNEPHPCLNRRHTHPAMHLGSAHPGLR